ncbi:hypothetical protein AK812_SmicGene30510 [Symbiodinium microadriaticum]|uniref:Uncharacterized protein n=1 Tax=Symbiodinium microadriaticum TaxID=2951 RepID=A0A1Q9CZ50_SYMMI|nr:hypothetical protein AK812_SmicGene30510 [Symbiodinium microadriaticum]
MVAVAPLLQEQSKIVILVDLTRLGGCRFAATIPSAWSVRDFEVAIVQPLFGAGGDRRVLVGPRQRPVTGQEVIDAEHGDVVAVLPSDQVAAAPLRLDDLLRVEVAKGDHHNATVTRPEPGVAVWCNERLEVFPRRAFVDGSALALIAAKAGFEEEVMSVAFAGGIAGLSIAGVACDLAGIPWQVAVQPLESRGTSAALVIDARSFGAGIRVVADVGQRVTLDQLVAFVQVPYLLRHVLCWREEARTESAQFVCCLIRLFPRARPFELSPREQIGALEVSGRDAEGGAADLADAQGERSAEEDSRSGHGEGTDEASSSAASSSDGSIADSEGSCLASVLVLCPDRIQQQVQVRVVSPCSGQDVADAVAHALDAEFYRLSSLLVPCRQQLSDRWGLMLALPAWAGDEPLVVIDTRECDGRLFLAPAAREISRQHALAVADMDDVSVDVYPFGRHDALAEGQSVRLQPFGVIQFVPEGANPGPVFSWTGVVRTINDGFGGGRMPDHTPSEQAGRLLAVLEDGCRHFTLMPGRAAFYALDVSTVFGIPLHWTSIQTARPPIKDCQYRGHACKGVFIVSDRIPNLPVPPRRPGFDFFFIILDCRPLLLGFEQWPVYDMFCSHSELVDHLSTFLPEDHQVQLEGATVEGDRLIVSRGSVLVAQYVPVTPLSWEPDGRRDEHSLDLEVSADAAPDGSPGQWRASGGSTGRDSPVSRSFRSRSPRRSPDMLQDGVMPGPEGETLAPLWGSDTLPTPGPVWHEVFVAYVVVAGLAESLRLLVGVIADGFFRCLCVRVIQLSAVMCRPRSKAHADPAGSAVCTSADVEGDDVGSLRGLPSDESWSRGLRQSRLLTEPAGSSDADRATMSNLRHLAAEIGGEWPYFEAQGVPGARPFVLHDPMAPTADMTGVTRWIKVVVLKPFFVPEELWVRVTFSALFADVKAAVQAVRDPVIADRFPVLWEVSPQTVEGVCVLLAGPDWARVANLVCVDARAWDGRIYAGLCPAYVDRNSALHVADIPPEGRVDVFFGWDHEPLQVGVHRYVYPALTLRFRPFYADASLVWSLADRLISGAGWSDVAVFPVLPEEDNYVLVLQDSFKFFQADSCRPAFYRRLLAEAAGVAEPGLVLVPAAPRVVDAAVNGRPCRTVLAGLSRSLLPDGAFCVFVDCRAIHRGWLCMPARHGRLPIAEVKDVIDDDGPPGWITTVIGRTAEHDVLVVEPGSVLIAVHVPVEVVAEPGVEWESEELSTFHDWLHDFMQVDGPARDEHSSEDLPLAPFAWHGPSQERPEVHSVIEAAFVVLTHDFAPELYHVQLPCPATLLQATVSLQRLRPSPQCTWFPRLVEVFPQPDTSFGTLLAAPSWATGGVLAVIDCRLIDGRLFCAVLPPRVDRESILAVAGLASTEDCEVYVRDEPWPMEANGVEVVREGELILIADYSLIADAVGVDETDLLLKQACPRIWDHWSDGRASKAVLLAVSMRGIGPLARSAVCILDLRPVLLGLQSAVFENGLVDTHELAGRLQQWRPEGYRVEVVGGQAGLALPVGWREVRDGDVLRLEFLPTRPPLNRITADIETAADPLGAEWSHAVGRGEDSRYEDVQGGHSQGVSNSVCLDSPFHARVMPLYISGRRRRRLAASSAVARTCFLLLGITACFDPVDAAQIAPVALGGGQESDVALGQEIRGRLRQGPVPTPCRNLFLGRPDEGSPEEVCSLITRNVCDVCTVLDGIKYSDPEGFFFEARVVLEVLCEDAVAQPRGEVEAARRATAGVGGVAGHAVCAESFARGPCAPCTIKLEDLVPETVAGSGGGPVFFDLTSGRCLLPVSSEQVRQVTVPFDSSRLIGPPADAPKPDRFADWVATGEPGGSPLQDEVLVLTADGSFCPETCRAGWAVTFSIADRPRHAASGDAAQQSQRFVCRCVTYNALSLLDGGDAPDGRGPGLHGAVGRVALLKRSLTLQQVFVAGIQEARTEAGQFQGDGFVRYCSGCHDRRSFGVELWVARGPAWPEHVFIVSHADPWRLLGRLSALGSTYNVLAGHGPHRGHSVAKRVAWWRETSTLCAKLPASDGWIVLVDGNCRVGSVVSDGIGEHHPDAQDEAGEVMHHLLLRLQAWLPCTFSQHMEGPGGTLYQRMNQELQRCDFVGIPQAWRQWEVKARVVPEITSGHALPDHLASLVECSMSWYGQKRAKGPTKIDVAAIRNEENYDRIDAILRSAPPIDWTANVNDHAAILAEYLYGSLSAAFPLNARRMRNSFLSEAAGALHANAAALRHALRGRVQALRLARLRCTWLAWKGDAVPFQTLLSGVWARQLRCSIAVLAERIATAGKVLRKQCRADKRAHLDSLADQVGQAEAAEVHTALKRLIRPKKFRSRGPAPLPSLKRADGTFCQTEDEVVRTWRKHFSDLEGGMNVSVEELVSFGLQQQAEAGAMQTLDAAQVPDLVTLAGIFKDVNPQKAAGPDMIPPAVCRRFACQLSVLFYPVLLRSLAYLSEPVGMKGGSLFRIPKPGAPDPTACTAQRAILVQSVLEKVLHKAVRGMTVQALDACAPPLLFGGRKGLSYQLGFFCTRAFLDFSRRKQMASAILFLDISSAYYSVVRELLVGGQLSGASVEELAASLSLSKDDLQFMQSLLADEPVLSGEGSQMLLPALTREMHCGTWFLMSQDTQLVRTRRGTRPGSSLADTLYALLFVKVLQRRGDFQQEGFCPTIPWSGIRDLQPFDGRRSAGAKVAVQDLIYADDMASCIVAPDAPSLPKVVQEFTGHTVDILTGHGLRPNIGPKKTAALLSVVGPKAREVRRQVFTTGKGMLPVLRERGPGFWLSVVPQYRHLGSIVSYDGSMVAEIKSRLQLARSCFQEGRQFVFCAPCIDLARRVSLFRTHVLSSLFAGSGAWPWLCSSSWKLLDSGVFNMVRQMLRIRPDQNQRWTKCQVLAAVGLPSVEGLLALERLRFLAQLVRHGPDEAFALLQQSPRALQAFGAAETWLLQAVRCTGAPGSFREVWDEWVDLFRKPGRWKGLLRRAESWHVGFIRAQAAYQSMVRSCWEATPKPVVPCDEIVHACLCCRVAFANCHAWSAHAAKVHGFRSKARRLAQGLRCQACAALFPMHRQYRRHLQVSVRCCQAIERGGPALFPAVLGKDGHPQGVVAEGVGVSHLPEIQPEMSYELLRQLRDGHFDSTEDIFGLVLSVFEPLPALQRTVDVWMQELGDGPTRHLAEDARLALQADLWCEHLSSAPRQVEDDPVDFTPLLAPFPGSPFAQAPPIGQPGRCRWRVVDFQEGAQSVGRSYVEVSWSHACPDLATIAGFSLRIPSSAVPCEEFWRPLSCPLRCLREHQRWLSLVLQWFAFAIHAAGSGVPCQIECDFPASKGGELAGWLFRIASLSPEGKKGDAGKTGAWPMKPWPVKPLWWRGRGNFKRSYNAPSCEDRVAAAQEEWKDAILSISAAYLQGGTNSSYEQLAVDAISKLYNYGESKVLFKPTLAIEDPFRENFIGAASYFLGYNATEEQGGFPEDKGFAINAGKTWSAVEFANNQTICVGDVALAQGYYYFTDGVTGNETGVEYTFAYEKMKKTGQLKIIAHHSSLPASFGR